MSYIRYPWYYKEFQCIASACSDSCCIGWEIDIDEETWEKYHKVDGDFGKRLQENIQTFQEGDGNCHCFSMDESQRCPFLNEKNLCDIIINLGEEYLGQICTDHPRYYDWFLDGKECGIGLCCEEAARLILQEGDGARLEQEEEQDVSFDVHREQEEEQDVSFDVHREQEEEQDVSFDVQRELEEEQEISFVTPRELEKKLFEMREELFSVIEPKFESESQKMQETFQEISNVNRLFQKMDRLYDAAYELQEEYDNWMFPEEVWEDGIEEEAFPTWEQTFWKEGFLQQLVDFYLDLVINEDAWRKLLKEVKEQIPEILRAKEVFFGIHRESLYEYENLLIYFIYRHFMSARNDDEVAEKVVFALVSTGIIQLLGVFRWLKKDKKKLEEADQIAICKLYSQEIEYHEENMNKVAGCLKFFEE